VTAVENGRAAQDIDAEQAVLSAMLQSRQAFAEVTRVLTGAEFYRGAHTTIYGALRDIAESGRPVEAVALMAVLKDRHELAKVGGAEYLHALLQLPTVPASGGFYAERVRLLHRTRRAAQLGTRVQQISEDVAPDMLQEALAAVAVELALLVDESGVDGPVDGLSTWADFLAEPSTAQDWVVPGLIEKQDVFMFLSASGLGKSWLSRQVALCIAAGVHPFLPDVRFPPQRTLLIDLENPPTALRRQSEVVFQQAERFGDPVRDRGWVWRYPQGFNLRKHADALLFERVVAETRPALLCLGSLYNAFQRGSSDWDTAAEEVKAVFNRVRAKYGCALWIEHHMPRAAGGGHQGSPFGSTVWERWPGFGRVLKKVGQNAYQLDDPFRGDRDAGRDIPVGLYRGGEFPWSSVWDMVELEALADKQLS
jgi:replicative DNA helicase